MTKWDNNTTSSWRMWHYQPLEWLKQYIHLSRLYFVAKKAVLYHHFAEMIVSVLCLKVESGAIPPSLLCAPFSATLLSLLDSWSCLGLPIWSPTGGSCSWCSSALFSWSWESFTGNSFQSWYSRYSKTHKEISDLGSTCLLGFSQSQLVGSWPRAGRRRPFKRSKGQLGWTEGPSHKNC